MENTQKVQVQILNAFVKNGLGGNPAGVVLDADAFTKNQKLQIASKVGLSETAFISKSDTADFKLDFFTPTRQIAHCGHATIAAFSYLKQSGMIVGTESSKETIEGNRKIKIEGDLAFMEQEKPKYTNISESETMILESLGLRKSDLIPNASVLLVNTGNSFIIVPVRDVKVLKNIKPDFKLISKVSDIHDLIGLYIFSVNEEESDLDVNARMFAPRYGIEEESATGMAAGPLAAYLYDQMGVKKSNFLIGQGSYMSIPSPSLIRVELQIVKGEIMSLMAGGKGLLKKQIQIEIESFKS